MAIKEFKCFRVNEYAAILALICSKYSIQAQALCDLYRTEWENGNSMENDFYTVGNYAPPSTIRTNKLQEDVRCPCNRSQPCLRKCCIFEKTFNSSAMKCRNADESKFDPESIALISPFQYTYVYGINCTFSKFTLVSDFDGLEQGDLISNWRSLKMDQYCFEYVEEQNRIMIFECKNGVVHPHAIYTISILTSIFFLIFTFVLYTYVGELGNLQGKCLLSYVTSLIISCTCEFLIQISSLTGGRICLNLGKSFIKIFWKNFTPHGQFDHIWPSEVPHAHCSTIGRYFEFSGRIRLNSVKSFGKISGRNFARLGQFDYKGSTRSLLAP